MSWKPLSGFHGDTHLFWVVEIEHMLLSYTSGPFMTPVCVSPPMSHNWNFTVYVLCYLALFVLFVFFEDVVLLSLAGLELAM